MPASEVKQIVEEAEAFVKKHFAGGKMGDPSKDWAHVLRVRNLAFELRGCGYTSLKQLKSEEDWKQLQKKRVEDDDDYYEVSCDYLVLELAALFAELVDQTIHLRGPALFTGVSEESTATTLLDLFRGPTSRGHAKQLDSEQKERIIEITLNIGWDIDERRRDAVWEDAVFVCNERGVRPPSPGNFKCCDHMYSSGVMRWPEFRVLSDADRLDAIGAIGLLRCAAYSGVHKQPLLSQDQLKDSDSAEEHFYAKLNSIRGDRLFTKAGKAEADRRQAFLDTFMQQLRGETDFPRRVRRRADHSDASARPQQRRRTAGPGADESATQAAAGVGEQSTAAAVGEQGVVAKEKAATGEAVTTSDGQTASTS